MLRLLKGIFRPETPPADLPNLRTLKTRIGPGIDRLALDIFACYRETLLDKPEAYIVPAIWGVRQNGQLDCKQKEIHAHVAPFLEEILAAFEVRDLGKEQTFAIRYLVNGYISSKINCIVYMYKNRQINQTAGKTQYLEMLTSCEPLGHA